MDQFTTPFVTAPRARRPLSAKDENSSGYEPSMKSSRPGKILRPSSVPVEAKAREKPRAPLTCVMTKGVAGEGEREEARRRAIERIRRTKQRMRDQRQQQQEERAKREHLKWQKRDERIRNFKSKVEDRKSPENIAGNGKEKKSADCSEEDGFAIDDRESSEVQDLLRFILTHKDDEDVPTDNLDLCPGEYRSTFSSPAQALTPPEPERVEAEEVDRLLTYVLTPKEGDEDLSFVMAEEEEEQKIGEVRGSALNADFDAEVLENPERAVKSATPVAFSLGRQLQAHSTAPPAPPPSNATTALQGNPVLGESAVVVSPSKLRRRVEGRYRAFFPSPKRTAVPASRECSKSRSVEAGGSMQCGRLSAVDTVEDKPLSTSILVVILLGMGLLAVPGAEELINRILYAATSAFLSFTGLVSGSEAESGYDAGWY